MKSDLNRQTQHFLDSSQQSLKQQETLSKMLHGATQDLRV